MNTTTNKNKIKPGYKKTPVGIIPEQWNLKKLGEIGEFKNGINKAKEDFGKGVPFVNLNDIFNLSYDNLQLVNATENEIKNYNLKKGDVLFVRSSVKPEGVGLTNVIEKDLERTVYSGFIIRFRTDSSLLLNYKNYCFYDPIFRNRLIIKSTVSANTNINQQALNSLYIKIPPLPEQKAIADCLTTWDKGIEKLSALIQSKKEQKKGLMQQLLTGEKRLDGFTEEWKKVRLEDISFKKSSSVQARSLIENSGNYNVYGASGFVTKVNHYDEEDPYIGIVKDGSGVGNLFLLEGKSSVLGTLDKIFPKNSNLIFLYGLMNTLNFEKYKVGGAIPHIYYKDYSKERILIPSVNEQAEIAKVLSTADKEIELLEKKLDQFKTQKKGLMQVLLTGEKRLV